MSAVDKMSAMRNRIVFEPIDDSLPGGVHIPKKEGDVGWDLEAMEDVTIGPMLSADVPVNAKLQLPRGIYADIRNRSSMARRGLYVDQNVIDTGYRGPLFVFIRNMQLPDHGTGLIGGARVADRRVTIKAGERIAQLIFHKVHPCWMQKGIVDPNSERGDTGFGSTGT